MKDVLIAFVLTLCLTAAPPVWGAKLWVTWTAPTTNTDGSPLTDLTGYWLEWGSCHPDGTFDLYQAGFNVGPTVTRAAIYPTGIPVVCARIYAIAANGMVSFASNTASAPVLAAPGQPIH